VFPIEQFIWLVCVAFFWGRSPWCGREWISLRLPSALTHHRMVLRYGMQILQIGRFTGIHSRDEHPLPGSWKSRYAYGVGFPASDYLLTVRVCRFL